MRRLTTDPSGTLRIEETIESSVAVVDEVVPATRWERVVAYFMLTKPRIIELLLVTTVPSMIVAAEGWPSPMLVFWTLLGGALSAGGANAINCYFDRDIDAVMTRTKRRPLPTHRVAPKRALIFGTTLGVVAFFLLWGTVNLPA